jgi:CHAD domain-containing protein
VAAGLKRKESGTAGARRILRRETKKALQRIRPRHPVRGEAIHDARKRLKKARAALRLVRDSLGGSEYRRENQSLRDAARPLSQVRDADVLIATLDGLVRRPTPAQRRIFRTMRQRFTAERRALQRQLHDDNALQAVREQLRDVRQRAGHWRSRGGWSIVGRGLERVYRAGRESYVAARREASNENLHECRKQTKYLWHQFQLLEPVRPGRMRRLQDQAHTLSDRLGDDHDLAVLRDKLEAARAALPDGAVSRIEPLLQHRRSELQREALALAGRLYDAPPSRFVERVATSWHAWRSGRTRRR